MARHRRGWLIAPRSGPHVLRSHTFASHNGLPRFELREEVGVQVNPLGTATAALKRLVIQRVITSFITNFEARGQSGFVPQVTVRILGQDELAIERARRQVQAEVRPILGQLVIVVLPEAQSAR